MNSLLSRIHPAPVTKWSEAVENAIKRQCGILLILLGILTWKQSKDELMSDLMGWFLFK